jgi:hypothetical protein
LRRTLLSNKRCSVVPADSSRHSDSLFGGPMHCGPATTADERLADRCPPPRVRFEPTTCQLTTMSPSRSRGSLGFPAGRSGIASETVVRDSRETDLAAGRWFTRSRGMEACQNAATTTRLGRRDHGDGGPGLLVLLLARHSLNNSSTESERVTPLGHSEPALCCRSCSVC